MSARNIAEQLASAREHALIGDYTSALVYYENVLRHIKKHIEAISDDNYTINQWHCCEKFIQGEMGLVKELNKEIKLFTKPRPPKPFDQVMPDHDDECMTHRMHGVMSHTARNPEPDPDVWEPPPRPAPTARARLNSHQGALQRSGSNLSSHGSMNGSQTSRSRKLSSMGSIKSTAQPKISSHRAKPEPEEPPVSQKYEGPDNDLVMMLEREMLDGSPGVKWDDIAGLTEAKNVLQEAAVLPLLRPDIFIGIRRPVKGVLLFGPPGTGKTMLAKAVASQANVSFFSVSSATLASKFRGESERMVRCLFDIARQRSPSIIFIDEIDALCTTRGAPGEHEASRRVKSEILTQIDGCSCKDAVAQQHVMVLAATNFPWDIDDALRRRLEKRIYIPLPGVQECKELLKISFKDDEIASDVEWNLIAEKLDGYSGDDIINICRDAALNGTRKAFAGKTMEEIINFQKSQLQTPVSMEDFLQSIKKSSPSVARDDLCHYERWNVEFGSW